MAWMISALTTVGAVSGATAEQHEGKAWQGGMSNCAMPTRVPRSASMPTSIQVTRNCCRLKPASQSAPPSDTPRSRDAGGLRRGISGHARPRLIDSRHVAHAGAHVIGAGCSHDDMSGVSTDRGASLCVIRVVAGMIMREGRVLVARRGPGMNLAGQSPGRQAEAGEGPEAALVRELRGIGHPRSTRGNPRSRVPQGDGMLQLEGWLADLTRGTPTAHEHDAPCMAAPQRDRPRTLAPADLPLLDALQALEPER